jgi:tubulin polyglutamylase TTLL11
MIIEKRNWLEVFDSNADIFWSGLNVNYDEFMVSFKTRLNRIPGMTELAHKRTTGFFLNKFQEYFPDRFTFYPITFLLPENLGKLEKFYKK